MKHFKGVIRWFGWGLILIGLFSFIGPMFLSNDWINYDNELPLEMPDGVVVSSSGFIFISIVSHGKIQCYDENGHFVKNWSVKGHGGDFRMKIKNDTLMIATARRGSLIMYDINGRLISSLPNENAYSEFKMNDPNKFSMDGFDYEIKLGFITEVWKTVGEVNTIVIRSTGLKLLFRGPIQAIMILICGFGMQMYTSPSLLTQAENYKGRLNFK